MFLPEYLIMLDAEMVGVCPERDALLQVACLKLKLFGTEYKTDRVPFVKYLQHDGQPTNDFHRTYLQDIFRRCNQSTLTPHQLKIALHEWLGPLKGIVTPAGDCVMTDLAFLYQHACADRPDIAPNGQPIPGTFHYEAFDIHVLKMLAYQKMGVKQKPPLLDIEHDALADCFNQTLELNYFIKVLLG